MGCACGHRKTTPDFVRGGKIMRRRYFLIGGVLAVLLLKLLGAETSPQPTQATFDVRSSDSGREIASIASAKSEPRQLEVRFVRNNGVALRSLPSLEGQILDRLDRNRRVYVLDARSGWTQVRHELTRREGWVATRFLVDERALDKDPPTKPSQSGKFTLPKAPSIPDALVIQRIIAQSLAGYSGSCACPYSRDRRGAQLRPSQRLFQTRRIRPYLLS